MRKKKGFTIVEQAIIPVVIYNAAENYEPYPDCSGLMPI